MESGRYSVSSTASTHDLMPIEAAQAKEHEADQLIASRELSAALQALHKAIFFRPDHAPLLAKLAAVYCELCDVKSAMATYRKLLSVDAHPSQRIKDQFAGLLDLHGYSLLVLGESPAIAMVYITEAIELNALNESFWLHRALAHIHAHDLDKALKDVDHCVNLNGREVEYFVLRAKLHWKLHMHEKATSDIHRAAKLMPDHPEVVEHEQRLLTESQAHYAQACKLIMARQFAEAITFLNNAAEIAPEGTKVYLLRAAAYRELGEFSTALRDVDTAMHCHRHKLDVTMKKRSHQAGLERASSIAGQPAAVSADQTREYGEIATQRTLILNDMALKLLHEKFFQLALNTMNQVIRGDIAVRERSREGFANPQYYVNRGDAYRGLGNFQAALADYHHALSMNPEAQEIQSRVALVHYQFGIDLFNQGLFDKAELAFEKAIAHDEQVAMYHVRKGDAARYQEKHHVASVDYQNAVRLNPADADTRNKLLQYAVRSSTGATPITATATATATTSRTTQPMPSIIQSSPQASPKQLPRGLADARQSYQQKNKIVQDLLRNRSTMQAPPRKESR